MKRRKLGQTGIEVSELAFGGVEIGIPYGIGVKGQEDMLGDGEAVALLHAAMDRGINFFDTARMYGRSEEIMGKAFHDRRDRVVISTKCKFAVDVSKDLPIRQMKQSVLDSLEESLRMLQTDYVDGIMIHTPEAAIFGHPEIMGVFSECKRQGKVRAIGVSTYSVEQTRRVIACGVWDYVQLAYSLMDQRQGEVFAEAQEHGLGIVVRSVLCKGILTDKGRTLHPQLQPVAEHRAKYQALLCAEAPTLSDLATKFVMAQPEVSAVLVGIDRMEYLDKAVAVANGQPLRAETLAQARALGFPKPEFIDFPKWDVLGWLR